MTRRKGTEGRTAFYRVYTPARCADLDSAVELAKEEAMEFGLTDLRVDERQTGTNMAGNYWVVLAGTKEE